MKGTRAVGAAHAKGLSIMFVSQQESQGNWMGRGKGMVSQQDTSLPDKLLRIPIVITYFGTGEITTG